MAELVARVFPRRTNASPTDDLSFFDAPGLFVPKIHRVHVSVTFMADLACAEQLAKSWSGIAPVQIGGPAIGMRGEEFTPGMYLGRGHVITSRGCPNRCWFCEVWRRDGDVRELIIHEGWKVHDDNLLACSEQHIRAVFRMLSRQSERAEFVGGLEAAQLRRWHVELLAKLKPRPKQIFCAYDTPNDYEPLIQAGRMFLDAGFTRASKCLRAYVLIGYPQDSLAAAEKRIERTFKAGFWPAAMLWHENRNLDWRRFQRTWARPCAMYCEARKRGWVQP